MQSRGGLGLKNLEVADKNGKVVGIAQIHDNEELLVMTEQGKILRTPASEIRTIGRATQSVRVMELDADALSSPSPLSNVRKRSRVAGL